MNPDGEEVQQQQQPTKQGRRTRMRGNRTKQKNKSKKDKSPSDAPLQKPIQLSQQLGMPMMVMPVEVGGRPVSYIPVDSSGVMLNQMLASQMMMDPTQQEFFVQPDLIAQEGDEETPRRSGLNHAAKPFQPQGLAVREENIAWTNAGLEAQKKADEDSATKSPSETDTESILASPTSAPVTPTIAASVLQQLDLSPTHGMDKAPSEDNEDDMWRTDFLLPKMEDDDDEVPELESGLAEVKDEPKHIPTPVDDKPEDKDEHIEEVPMSSGELEGGANPVNGMGIGVGAMPMPMGMGMGMGMGMPVGVGMPAMGVGMPGMPGMGMGMPMGMNMMGMGMPMVGMQPMMMGSQLVMPGGMQMIPVAMPGMGMPQPVQGVQVGGMMGGEKPGGQNVLDLLKKGTTTQPGPPSPPSAPAPPPVPPQQLGVDASVLDFFKGAHAVASDDFASTELLKKL